jgi:hypothetical protein
MSDTNRALLKIILLGILVLGGSAGMWSFERQNGNSGSRQAKERAARALAEAQQLRQVAQRLEAGPRTADVLVTDQSETDGVLNTTLLFQEYARDGSLLAPRRLNLRGDKAHIDALVIRFQGRYVQEHEPLGGASLGLFMRIFGDNDAPENAQQIDEPGHIPAVYGDADPKVSEFEQDLWRDFWKLADNDAYARQSGVQVAQRHSVFPAFEMGRLYTLSLQPDAGISIKSEPLKGIYLEMLKQNKQFLTTRWSGD